jgi:hypothetical protein
MQPRLVAETDRNCSRPVPFRLNRRQKARKNKGVGKPPKKKYLLTMTRGEVGSFIVFGVFMFGLAVAVFTIKEFTKNLASKKGRKEIVDSAKRVSDTFLHDKSFHKDLKEGFKWEIRSAALIVIVLILILLFPELA